MFLRMLLIFLGVVSLSGCAGFWEKEYVDSMNHPEKENHCNFVRIKDTAHGAAKRSSFNERVETWQ